MINQLLTDLFGRHHYRAAFIYLKNGKELFRFNTTVSVTRKYFIDKHRDVKKNCNIIKNLDPLYRRMLCNGVIAFEPVCYLGRW